MNYPFIAFCGEALFTWCEAALIAGALTSLLKGNIENKPSWLRNFFCVVGILIVNDVAIGLIHLISRIK